MASKHKKRRSYVYPFGKGLAIGRTDMGIDPYPSGGGSVKIRTIGKARYLGMGGSGWPTEGGSGTGPVYRIIRGPLKGKIIYTYEGITPKNLKPGQKLKKGQVIAKATGSSFESGFAFGKRKGYQPIASTYYTEGMATKEGKQFAKLVDKLAHGWQGPKVKSKGKFERNKKQKPTKITPTAFNPKIKSTQMQAAAQTKQNTRQAKVDVAQSNIAALRQELLSMPPLPKAKVHRSTTKVRQVSGL